MSDDEQYIVKTYKSSLSKYFVMGKLAVLKSRLYDGKLRVVYSKNLNTYSKIKLTQVSNDFIKCFIDLITNKDNFDMYLYMALNLQESKIILTILGDSGYGREIGFDEVKAYKNRLKVLQGELATGNENKELITECLNVVKKLRQLNAISIEGARAILTDLEDF